MPGRPPSGRRSCRAVATSRGSGRVAETVALYTIYLKKMMGILQAKEIEEGRGENLPVGRLQFFHIKTKYHYRLLEKEAFESAVLDKLRSGGVKMHCLAACNWLVRSVKLYLTTPEAGDPGLPGWVPPG